MGKSNNWHEDYHNSRGYGQKLADGVANGMGSWKFIIAQTVIVLLWIG
ncbi:DUF1003 domain-containing protein [Mucilaginibacter ginkgonis]|uniref:Uncharacterized protein n=1 Tax=Mucilaginibacter ginkgonis TaxID=2682091 RepID=A0A7T7FAR0_9SPHI|nr:hypothetical protein [Mucilaginibacter ginkgonis]QQL49935.1 hypothetical protein GO620_000345 [Mucilaginibacter ginkgonis]